MTASRWPIALVAVAIALVALPAQGTATVTPQAAPPSCAGRPATIIGTAGNDSLVGTPGADVIVARGGDDRINGVRGNDLICAGDGDDTVFAGRGRDDVEGGEGSDVLRGGQGPDSFFGGGGSDDIVDRRGHTFVNAEESSTVVTGPLRDVILATGTEASLVVHSNGGNDKIRMFWGTAVAGPGNDVVIFRGYHVGSSLHADLGLGDDRLSFDIPRRHVPPGARVDADGGPGTDAIAALNVSDDLFAVTLGPTGSMTGPATGAMLHFENVNAGDAFVHTDITGSAGPNRVIAGVSDDTVHGLGGDDDLRTGRFGDDSIDGGDGNDRCVGDTAVVVNCEILV